MLLHIFLLLKNFRLTILSPVKNRDYPSTHYFYLLDKLKNEAFYSFHYIKFINK